MHAIKNPHGIPWVFFGGEGEIRTRGTLRYAAFPRRCTRPLCDLSKRGRVYPSFRFDASFKSGYCRVDFLRFWKVGFATKFVQFQGADEHSRSVLPGTMRLRTGGDAENGQTWVANQRVVAQLVARLHGVQEVVGSSPADPTKKPSLLFAGRFFYFPCFTLHAAGRTRGKSINDHASMPPERLITRQSLSVSASATRELLPPDLQ